MYSFILSMNFLYCFSPHRVNRVVCDTQYYEELDMVIASLSKTLPFTFRVIAMIAKICKTNLQIYEWYYMCIYINSNNHVKFFIILCVTNHPVHTVRTKNEENVYVR
jgi:hypothetical protein